MTDDKKETYNDGQRDQRLDDLEKWRDEVKPRLSRVERIVYGAVSIFGAVSYWPQIQKFLQAVGLGGH